MVCATGVDPSVARGGAGGGGVGRVPPEMAGEPLLFEDTDGGSREERGGPCVLDDSRGVAVGGGRATAVAVGCCWD